MRTGKFGITVLLLACLASAAQADFLDDFSSDTSGSYTGSGSIAGFTVSGGTLNIDSDSSTASVMTTASHAFAVGDTLSIDAMTLPADNHKDSMLMMSTYAGQPNGSSSYGIRLSRDAGNGVLVKYYTGGDSHATTAISDPDITKTATLLIERIAATQFACSIEVDGSETSVATVTIPELSSVTDLHIGAQFYKTTTGVFDNLQIVPEPTTLGLLGLGGLAIARRHKR